MGAGLEALLEFGIHLEEVVALRLDLQSAKGASGVVEYLRRGVICHWRGVRCIVHGESSVLRLDS